jgi:hypothetical protein
VNSALGENHGDATIDWTCRTFLIAVLRRCTGRDAGAFDGRYDRRCRQARPAPESRYRPRDGADTAYLDRRVESATRGSHTPARRDRRSRRHTRRRIRRVHAQSERRASTSRATSCLRNRLLTQAMARIVLLDSTPLGLVCRRRGHRQGDICRAWLDRLLLAGVIVVVPEIADYEVRRELIRAGAHTGLMRLNALSTSLSYDPITTPAVHKAAEFWADVRRRGLPTAADQSLDADALLAAQATLIGAPGDTVYVATSNPVHLIRFPGIDARDWASITP